MKFKHYLIVFIAAFGLSFFFASCLNEDNKIPPNCFDGILNNDEEGIDCGGSCSEPCDHCINGIYEPNKGETWRDCGGVDCPPCAQCANGIKDGDEVGIDCGGSCGGCEMLCGDGLLNGLEDELDCEYDEANVEESCDHCPTCVDGVMNGTEVGIDCGGSNCAPCCTTNNCRNGIVDGNEFWTDCGGSICHDCQDTLYFKVLPSTSYFFLPAAFMDVDVANDPVINVTTAGFTSNGGGITLTFTVFPTPNQQYDLATVDPTVANITYTNEIGALHSSAFGGAMGKITFVKKATVTVPDNALDGCHKPAGTYTFYKATLSNVIIKTIDGVATTISDGSFQYTEFTP